MGGSLLGNGHKKVRRYIGHTEEFIESPRDLLEDESKGHKLCIFIYIILIKCISR